MNQKISIDVPFSYWINSRDYHRYIVLENLHPGDRVYFHFPDTGRLNFVKSGDTYIQIPEEYLSYVETKRIITTPVTDRKISINFQYDQIVEKTRDEIISEYKINRQNFFRAKEKYQEVREKIISDLYQAVDFTNKHFKMFSPDGEKSFIGNYGKIDSRTRKELVDMILTQVDLDISSDEKYMEAIGEKIKNDDFYLLSAINFNNEILTINNTLDSFFVKIQLNSLDIYTKYQNGWVKGNRVEIKKRGGKWKVMFGTTGGDEVIKISQTDMRNKQKLFKI